MTDGHRTPDGHRTDNFAPLLNFAQLPKLHVLHHKGLAQNQNRLFVVGDENSTRTLPINPQATPPWGVVGMDMVYVSVFEILKTAQNSGQRSQSWQKKTCKAHKNRAHAIKTCRFCSNCGLNRLIHVLSVSSHFVWPKNNKYWQRYAHMSAFLSVRLGVLRSAIY